MSILLKSGLNLNLVTGQVFLTQDVSQDTEVIETSEEAMDSADDEMTVAEDEVGTEVESEAEGMEDTLEGDVSLDTSIEGEESYIEEGDMGVVEDEYYEDYTGMDSSIYDSMYGMTGMDSTEVKDPLLSNWFFVIGVSAATFVVSVVLGILLAKKRIKKGIELYEN